MAIEFFDGFEAGMLDRWADFTTSNIVAGAARSGGYGLSSLGVGQYFTLTLPASAKKTIGFAYKLDAGGWGSASHQMLMIYSGADLHLNVSFDGSLGHITVRRGDNTLLATSALNYTFAGVWKYIEVQATIADSGGTCIVRVDGTEWINFTGDTRNAGSATDIDKVRMFHPSAFGATTDDWYVTNGTDDTATSGRADNGFLGDLKVEGLLPNGNGATSQWVGSDGNSTDNYLLVDEQPANTSDYVGSSVIGDRDFWTMADTATTGTVYAVSGVVHAAKSDAGAAALKVLLRDSGGTVVTGSSISMSTTWVTYNGTVYTAKPTGGAWTVAAVNGLQLGVERA